MASPNNPANSLTCFWLRSAAVNTRPAKLLTSTATNGASSSVASDSCQSSEIM